MVMMTLNIKKTFHFQLRKRKSNFISAIVMKEHPRRRKKDQVEIIIQIRWSWVNRREKRLHSMNWIMYSINSQQLEEATIIWDHRMQWSKGALTLISLNRKLLILIEEIGLLSHQWEVHSDKCKDQWQEAVTMLRVQVIANKKKHQVLNKRIRHLWYTLLKNSNSLISLGLIRIIMVLLFKCKVISLISHKSLYLLKEMARNIN